MASLQIITTLCLVTECDRPNRTKGMCAAHYTQWWGGVAVEGISPRWGRPDCAETACTEAAASRAVCRKHYEVLRASGRLDERPRIRPQPMVCTVNGCELPHNARGLCSLHYGRSEHKKSSGTARVDNLWRNYRMTVATYEAMLVEQHGCCSICGISAEVLDRRLSIDHDHSCCPGVRSCGACVRGLLCMSCNNGLGRFRDDANRLLLAAAYLKRWS